MEFELFRVRMSLIGKLKVEDKLVRLRFAQI